MLRRNTRNVHQPQRGPVEVRCLFVILCLAAAGCAGSRTLAETSPDERFGHRYEGQAPDGRRTVSIDPAAGDNQYAYYPATVETVVIRPAPIPADDPEAATAVEALVKGAFPDGCLQLHSFVQERTGNIVEATLQMRRPQGAVCTSVFRPYRFYVTLEGQYAPGHYTLKLNGRAVPFEVRIAEAES